jgi:hypothetical protein
LETQFGVGVDIATHRNDAGRFGSDGVEQFHIHPCYVAWVNSLPDTSLRAQRINLAPRAAGSASPFDGF